MSLLSYSILRRQPAIYQLCPLRLANSFLAGLPAKCRRLDTIGYPFHKNSMARFPFSPVFLFVAVVASLAVAHAQPPLRPEPEPGVTSDPPPVMTAGERRARELWNTLSDEDKAFVKDFIARNNLSLLSPDLLSLRGQGKNDEAIKMLQKYYGIQDPVRAGIILKLLAYAQDQL